MTLLLPWGPVQDLILAAGNRIDDVSTVVKDVGLSATMDVLCEEIELRCEPVPDAAGTQVQLEAVHDAERAGLVISFDADGVSAERGWLDGGRPLVRYDLVDLVTALFGPGEVNPPSRNVLIDLPPRDQWSAGFGPVVKLIKACNAVMAAVSVRPHDLGALSIANGSDKWGGWHWYTPHYEHHFARLRDRPVRLLEIGIGGYTDPNLGGAGLRLWRRWFCRGLVCGLDLHPKPGVEGSRIRTVQGDQTDAALLDSLGRTAGPFDIVVDDGSHVCEHVIHTFHRLFPHVCPGGLYVIEDLQTSYWAEFGGSDVNLTGGWTTVGFLKTLLDGLHHPEYDQGPDHQPSYTDLHIAGVHFYRNIAFVEKGLNTVEGLPVLRGQPG